MAAGEIEDIRVSSWSELQESLFEDAWDPGIERFRSPYAFRGVSDAGYELRTSLSRLGGPFTEMETHLLRNFRKYADGSVVEADSPWHWLALAQHHGLPTRLLDWTYSPFVALHFATADPRKFGVDGAIWAVHHRQAHRLLPESLREKLREEGSDAFTVEMLLEGASSLEAFGTLSEEPFLLFFEPPSMSERIVNQYALFSTMSRADADLSAWLKRHPELWHRIILPAELKWEVRDKLDQANITERVLFPGLDGLSRWLARVYCSREDLESGAEGGA